LERTKKVCSAKPIAAVRCVLSHPSQSARWMGHPMHECDQVGKPNVVSHTQFHPLWIVDADERLEQRRGFPILDR
ncbi:MAG: hypothetical protein P4K97_09325, partial [Terracidiphilus sp.]|nr:hypothetical protein [Terracidiphilus sp.]